MRKLYSLKLYEPIAGQVNAAIVRAPAEQIARAWAGMLWTGAGTNPWHDPDMSMCYSITGENGDSGLVMFSMQPSLEIA